MPQLLKQETRFWDKVDRRGQHDCWPWMASRSKRGYGWAWFNDRAHPAHRVAFFLIHVWWPPVVMHSCDNPSCCNPAHLIAGDNAKNSDDKVSKDRQTKGEEHGRAILNQKDVKKIRSSRGVLTQLQLAHEFGVASSTIHYAQTGVTWKHV